MRAKNPKKNNSIFIFTINQTNQDIQKKFTGNALEQDPYNNPLNYFQVCVFHYNAVNIQIHFQMVYYTYCT